MSINISKKTKQKISKKSIILICLSIFILIGAGFLLIGPILNKIDQNRFTSLDSQMQKLFSEIETSSVADNAWAYEKKCEPEYSGPWPTGYYNCSVAISTEKAVTSVDEFNDFQNINYPIIDSSKILKATSELDKQLPGDFGVNLVVSSSQKIYNELSTNTRCSYLNKIYQSVVSDDFSTNEYGSSITNNIGTAIIKLECADKARGDWYAAD